MREVLIGQTDYTVLVRITGADGAPETALAHTDIDIAYSRVETDNDVTTTDVAPADLANLTAAHSDWGWEEVSASDHPGLYRLDIADAVFASGAWEAVVTITDASGSDFYAHDIGFRLVAFNVQDGVRLGLTALPNAAPDTSGGLGVVAGTNPIPANATQVEGTDATNYFATLDDAVLTAIAALNNLSSAGAQAAAEAALAAYGAATAAALAAVAADLPTRITKNVALAGFTFTMVDSTDHVTGKTGLTITATRSLDGAAFGACANSASEVGNGVYKIDLAAGDLNGNTVTLKFAATGADTRIIHIVTQPT